MAVEGVVGTFLQFVRFSHLGGEIVGMFVANIGY